MNNVAIIEPSILHNYVASQSDDVNVGVLSISTHCWYACHVIAMISRTHGFFQSVGFSSDNILYSCLSLMFYFMYFFGASDSSTDRMN